jgi:hypothetical protein
MNKTPTLPVAKVEAAPAPMSTPAIEKIPVFTKPEPAKIDLNKPVIKEAVTKAKAIIAEGKTKVEAAMLIFEALKAEDKEVVIAAFIQGATLTEKGAITYFYNCRRKSKKLAKPA